MRVLLIMLLLLVTGTGCLTEKVVDKFEAMESREINLPTTDLQAGITGEGNILLKNKWRCFHLKREEGSLFSAETGERLKVETNLKTYCLDSEPDVQEDDYLNLKSENNKYFVYDLKLKDKDVEEIFVRREDKPDRYFAKRAGLAILTPIALVGDLATFGAGVGLCATAATLCMGVFFLK